MASIDWIEEFRFYGPNMWNGLPSAPRDDIYWTRSKESKDVVILVPGTRAQKSAP